MTQRLKSNFGAAGEEFGAGLAGGSFVFCCQSDPTKKADPAALFGNMMGDFAGVTLIHGQDISKITPVAQNDDKRVSASADTQRALRASMARRLSYHM